MVIGRIPCGRRPAQRDSNRKGHGSLALERSQKAEGGEKATAFNAEVFKSAHHVETSSSPCFILVEKRPKCKRFDGPSRVFVAFEVSLSGLILKAYVFGAGTPLNPRRCFDGEVNYFRTFSRSFFHCNALSLNGLRRHCESFLNLSGCGLVGRDASDYITSEGFFTRKKQANLPIVAGQKRWLTRLMTDLPRRSLFLRLRR